MFFSSLYLAVRALFGLLVGSRRGPDVKDVERLVLRHELGVLRRQVGRPRLRMADRALLAAAACHLPRPSASSLLVTPRTIFAVAPVARLVEVAAVQQTSGPTEALTWRHGSSSCGWPARIPAGVIAGSAESSPKLGLACRRQPSGDCSQPRGWARRRGVRDRPGASSSRPRRRASSRATSSVRHEAPCERRGRTDNSHPCRLECRPRADAAARRSWGQPRRGIARWRWEQPRQRERPGGTARRPRAR